MVVDIGPNLKDLLETILDCIVVIFIIWKI